MDSRKIACMAAAAFVGVALAASATSALARQPIVVTAEKADPTLQRIVSYADLNLAFRADQNRLQHRIYRTAGSLCVDLLRLSDLDQCTYEAVDSTKGQVADAIFRAKQQVAGLPVGPAVAMGMSVSGR